MTPKITTLVVCLFALAAEAKPATTQAQPAPVREQAAAATKQIKENGRALESLARLIAQLKLVLKENQHGFIDPRVTPHRRPRRN